MSILGPDPCMTVSIGDVEIHGSNPPRDRAVFSLTRLDGWSNGAPASGGPVPWETFDGGIPGDVHMQGRVITIEGDIEACCHEDLTEAVDRLARIGVASRWETLTVDEAIHTGHVRQIQVCRLRAPMVEQLSPTFALFTLTLQSAGFPRLDVSSSSVTVGSKTALVNAGTYPADLTLDLKGPLENPGITWDGGTWDYKGSVNSGQTIQVDMTRRTVRNLDTAVHSRRLAQGDWLRLPPGTTTMTRTGTGAGTITASWRSAWA